MRSLFYDPSILGVENGVVLLRKTYGVMILLELLD